MKKKSLTLAVICMLAISLISRGQDKQGATLSGAFSKEQMKTNWARFTQDEGFSALLKDVKSKGYVQLPTENAAWGFESVLKDAAGKDQPVLFCAYDFYNPKSAKGQGCSMIWKKVGDKLYKAYVVFPEGEKNIQEALKGATEWYADENAKVQVAHSWHTCFLKCVQTNGTAPGIDVDIKNGKVKVGGSTYTLNCATSCYAGAIACSAIAAGVAISGVGVPFAVAILATCVSATCLPCIALCSLGCM